MTTVTAITGKCIDCGHIFILGVTGIETADGDKCDTCAGVIRDRVGYAYMNKQFKCFCTDPVHPGDNENCPVHGGK